MTCLLLSRCVNFRSPMYCSLLLDVVKGVFLWLSYFQADMIFLNREHTFHQFLNVLNDVFCWHAYF